MTSPAQQQVATPYYTYGILYLSPNFHRWEASKGDGYRAYRLGWATRAAQHDPGAFPLNLNLEVTSRCNLACTFCTQPSLTKDQLGDMPWELYTKVMDEGARHQAPAANLNGLGEPLLLRRLPEMIAYAKQRGFLDVMFHTNGTIMTEPLARALIESGLDRIIFSVDSPDRATYESMRLRSSWDRVVANVRAFAAARQQMGRTTPIIRTTMVVTDRTVQQVRAFVSMWRPVADQITLQDLTWRTKLLDNGEWRNREHTALPTDMDGIRAAAKQRGLSFVCPYLYQSTYAFWNGDVIPCSNPNARTHMIMGRLPDQSLSEVWHGSTYKALRVLHETGQWDEHPICRQCEVPLIELYKALDAQGVALPPEASSAPATSDQPVVASALAPRDAGAEDFVLQYGPQAAAPAVEAPPAVSPPEALPPPAGAGGRRIGRVTRMAGQRRVVAIHQPETLPWLGFLDKLRQCDVFVLLDDVQFEKHYFQNRNRIRTPTPRGWSWLTIPVRIGGRFGQRIDQVEIDDATNWRRKHLAAIEQHYHRAEAFARYWPALQARYADAPARLAEFNIAMIQWMMEAVGVVRPLMRSSALGVEGGRSVRLLEICRRADATDYLSGVSGRDYLDLGVFERAGIGVRFQEFRHPAYRQCYEPFVPAMSGVDLLLNYGEAAGEVLACPPAQPSAVLAP